MIRQANPHRLVLASCLLALVGAGAGCSKPPSPEFRVINESELKVKVKGGEEIAAAAPSAPAAPAGTSADGESK